MCDESTIPIFAIRNESDGILSMDEARRILSDAESGRVPLEQITRLPPVLPKGGEVYVYRAKAGDDEKDFRFDQYRWVNRGSTRQSPTAQVIKHYFWIKDPDGIGKKCLPDFQRMVFFLRHPAESKYFLIYYHGDSSVHLSTKHGNRKHGDRPFIPTQKKVFKEIDKESKIKPSSIGVYRSLLAKQHKNADDTQHVPVDRPRDLVQVQNKIAQGRKSERLTNDEIFGVNELAYQLPFIHSIQCFPDLVVICTLECAIELTTKLIKLSDRKPELPQLVSYDTTFKLGDFYLSTLVVRNVALKGDPIYPAAFMLHERKFQVTHERFLSTVLPLIGLNKSNNVPFACDREKGITMPLKKLYPDIPLIFCGNHLLSDVEVWVKKHGGKGDDVKVYKDDIERLRDCETIDSFTETYNILRASWSEPFSEYIESHLLNDIINHGARFVTTRYAAFHDKHATNNISESFNRVLKSEVNWQELPADSMVLALYYLSCYYMHEFQRASMQLGIYQVKKEFSNSALMNVSVPDFLPPESIVQEIHSHHLGLHVGKVEKSNTYRLTQKSLARLCVDKQCVSLHAPFGCYLVKSVNKDVVYAVKRNEHGFLKCTCPSTGKCYHVIAVELATNQETADKNTYHLTQMRKKQRGREPKSGRKRPRPKDYDYDVTIAPDSEISKTQIMSDDSDLEISPIVTRHPNLQSTLIESVQYENAGSETIMPEWKRVTPTDNTFNGLNHLLKCLVPPGRFPKHKEEDAWLNGDVIQLIIENHLQHNNLEDVAIVCPDFLQHLVITNQWRRVIENLHSTAALNKDIIFAPLNSVPTPGLGVHWLLGVINMVTKTIYVLDSMYSCRKDYSRFFRYLLLLAASCYEIGRIPFHQTDWEIKLCSNAPQQNNGYDCGIFVGIYACSVIEGSYCTDIDTLAARAWMAEKLKERLENPLIGRGKKIGRRVAISEKIVKEMSENLDSCSKHLHECRTVRKVSYKDVTRIMAELKLHEDWTVCKFEKCKHDEEHSRNQVKCIKCQNWYHTDCMPRKPEDPLRLPDYYICC